jgi:hypothetical protein
MARFDRIDRSQLGSIDFGVVGPTRARGKRGDLLRRPADNDVTAIPHSLTGRKLKEIRADIRRTDGRPKA